MSMMSGRPEESRELTLRASGLARSFSSACALRDVSLNLTAGSVCALLGKNGAGKTTLLKLFMGLIQPTAGSCHVFGSPVWPPPQSSLRRVGCLLDGFEPPGMTRLQSLIDLSRAAGPDFDSGQAKQLLAARDLAPRRRWMTLSKGQKRWALLTMLLSRRCDLLLLDEPADGLDPQARIDLYQLVRQQANDRNITALIATHVMSDVERVADQICILHRQSVLLQADLEELREQVTVIECDTASSHYELPEGVNLLHVRQAGGVELWLRDTVNGLKSVSLESEVRRRKATLEELFLALTEEVAPTSVESQRVGSSNVPAEFILQSDL